MQSRLWQQAYDELKVKEGKVVERYEEILSSKVTLTPGGGWSQLEDIVRSGLQKTKNVSEISQQIQCGMGAISPVKGILDQAAHAAPGGAATWLVICFGLEVGSYPHDTSRLCLLTRERYYQTQLRSK
ncbi:hypothetical protein IMZ48_24195 [Candidatus Bathyarchaeota archaeon]|nr:hypothetical protein [Candidatus Bathyarchaeota archaeon]